MDNCGININKEKTIQLLDHLAVLTGVRLFCSDSSQLGFFSHKEAKSNFCNLIRTNQEINTRCTYCDVAAFDKVKRSRQGYLYSCHMGLWEGVQPVFLIDNIVNYLMISQIRIRGVSSWEDIRNSLKNVGFGPLQLMEAQTAYEQMPEYGPEEINAVMGILKILCEHISNNNLVSLGSFPKIEKAIVYINERYTEKITVGEIAEQLGVSKATLINKFKRATNMSVHGYIERLRISKALRLLETSQLSIKEIAFQCGFEDQNYFSRAFKRNTNLSPSQYKGQFRKG